MRTRLVDEVVVAVAVAVVAAVAVVDEAVVTMERGAKDHGRKTKTTNEPKS